MEYENLDMVKWLRFWILVSLAKSTKQAKIIGLLPYKMGTQINSEFR